jgi:hypothetical protein
MKCGYKEELHVTDVIYYNNKRLPNKMMGMRGKEDR